MLFWDMKEGRIIDQIYGGFAFVGIHENEVQVLVEEALTSQKYDRDVDKFSKVLGRKMYLGFYTLGVTPEKLTVLDLVRWKPS
jgi:hypothetical protein